MSRLPAAWEILKFKKVCKIVEGQVDPKDEPYSNMKHIGPGNIEKFTGRFSNVKTAREDGQTSGKYLFNSRHVIYGKINPHFAKACYPEFDGVCSADAYPIECVEGRLIPKFLLYSILDERFTSYAVSVSGRTGMPKINRDDLELYDFFIPPVQEQKKISEILVSVDKVIELTDIEIGKLQNIKKGMMQDLLTKGVGHSKFKDSPLGKFPESWDLKKLENLAKRIGDGLHSTPQYVENSDYFFINGNNIKNGKVEIDSSTKCISKDEYEKHRRELSCNTILMSINGTIGNLAFYRNESVVLGKSAAYIDLLDKTYLEYIYYYLDTDFVRNYFELELTGSTISNLSLKSIRNITIALPPNNEMNKITSALKTVDETLNFKKLKLERFMNLKNGLMQDLLKGRVRVKV